MRGKCVFNNIGNSSLTHTPLMHPS